MGRKSEAFARHGRGDPVTVMSAPCLVKLRHQVMALEGFKRRGCSLFATGFCRYSLPMGKGRGCLRFVRSNSWHPVEEEARYGKSCEYWKTSAPSDAGRISDCTLDLLVCVRPGLCVRLGWGDL